MDSNLLGFILSYVLVFAVLAIASLLLYFKVFSPETLRKLVHIGVSNWWLLAMAYFDRPLYPAIGAASFIIINYISYKKHVFKAMESPEHRENLGTVYFPVSLLVLSYLCFGGWMPLYVGAIGILVMGYGDGLAALAGMNFGKHSFTMYGRSRKSIEGSLAMFAVSFAVIWLVLHFYGPGASLAAVLLTALVATAVEVATPFGLDNITVPLTSSLFYFLVFAT